MKIFLKTCDMVKSTRTEFLFIISHNIIFVVVEMGLDFDNLLQIKMKINSILRNMIARYLKG